MNKIIRLGIPVFALLALTGMTLWSGARAQEFLTLTPNTPTAGELTSRAGDEWIFQACAGETVTLLMESDAFTPLLELYAPTGRDPLAEGEEAEETTADAAVMIEDLTLGAAGEYLVVAAGTSVRDRGAYSLTLVMDQSAGLDEEELVLRYGAPVDGEIASRVGEEWLFHGCQGDVISLQMESDEVAPRLELFGPTGRDPVATSEDDETETSAGIEEFVLEETGVYLVAAIGQSIRGRGEYALTVELVDQIELEPTATPTNTRRPTPTRTRTPTPTPTPDAIRCLVRVPALNVRSGPGTEYTPPIAALARGDEVRALARDENAGWAEVVITETSETGWVSASAQYLSCNGDLEELELGEIPPTPIPTRTPTPTTTPTPGPPTATTAPPDPLDPIGVVIDAPGPGGSDVLSGAVYTANYFGPSDEPRFQDRFYLELFVRDTKEGFELGDGIREVKFEIFLDGSSSPIYSTTERTPRFCSFGGNEQCEVLRLRPGVTWPGTNERIRASAGYRADITAFPTRSDTSQATWTIFFELDFDDGDGGGNGGGNQGQIVAEFAQIFGNSSNELVFQVVAFDTDRGNDDGDGIRNVRHEIFGPDNRRVYERTENNAHYCAFSGGEPDCDVFRFTIGETNWEDTNNRVEAGPHRLKATVRTDDNREVSIETTIQIR